MKSVGFLLVATLTTGLSAAPEPEKTEVAENAFAKASCEFTLDLLKSSWIRPVRRRTSSKINVDSDAERESPTPDNLGWMGFVRQMLTFNGLALTYVNVKKYPNEAVETARPGTASKDNDENHLFSPSSIAILLAILQQGAKENTAEQLEKVLHLSAEDSKSGYGSVIQSLRGEKMNLTLEWGNRAFIVPGFDLEKEFLRSVEEHFNATFEELDFKRLSPIDAATKINDWVKEATHDSIQDLVDPSFLSSDVIVVLVNAIFFKSIWDSPFQKYKTRNEKFQASSEIKVEVPFMSQAGRFIAGEDTEIGIKWVELPFKDENFSTIFVLPIEANGLNQVIENLTGGTLMHVISNKGTRRVKMTIPKFKLTEKVSLVDTFKELGLTDVFTDESNLKGISSSEGAGLKLSQLIHQATIEIDEDGSTAAAATFQIAQTLSFEWFTDELYFRADHPFLFFIIDKLNEIPIFAGKIVNPKSSVPK